MSKEKCWLMYNAKQEELQTEIVILKWHQDVIFSSHGIITTILARLLKGEVHPLLTWENSFLR